MKKNNFHPIQILLIMFSILIPIIISTNIYIVLLYGITGILYLFLFKLNFKTFLILLLILIPISISVLFLNVLYPNKALIDTTKYFYFKNIKIYNDALYRGLRLFLRYYLLTLISISSVTLIDFFTLIFSLIQQFRLSPLLGYPAFIAINAIKHAQSEYQRILIIKKLRKIKGLNIFSTAIPLLVYAVRFSERSSIALLSKGFTKNRVYFFDYSISEKELKIVLLISLLNILYFLLLCLLI